MNNRLKVVEQGITKDICEVHFSSDDGVEGIARVYYVHGGKQDLLWRKSNKIVGFIRTSDGFFLRTSDGYFIRCSDQK